MGLLDDAIREHLELKRQRGADPGEVERQEREALGARKQAEFAAPAEEEPVAEATEPVDAGEEREPFDAEEGEPFDVEAVEEDEVEPPPEPEASGPGAEAAGPGYEEDPWLEEERDGVPAGESLDRPREESEEPAEDVLEDTPDFLQETPEHDRLWFEQRPPRDFDWDK